MNHVSRVLAATILGVVVLGPSPALAQGPGQPYDLFDKKPGLTVLDACALIHETFKESPIPQADVNGDGFANVTDVVALLLAVTDKGRGDFDHDGDTDVADRQYILSQWAASPQDLQCDLNEDQKVTVADVQIFTLIWLAINYGCGALPS